MVGATREATARHALALTRLLRTVTGSRRGDGEITGKLGWATGAIQARVRPNVQPRAPLGTLV